MIRTIYTFYRDGFRRMRVGKKLWAIIFIKLFIMFAVLKAFFFPNFLKTNFETDNERAGHVLANFTQSQNFHDSSGPVQGGKLSGRETASTKVGF